MQNRRLLPHLLRQVLALKPDVFVLGGDLGNNLAEWRNALCQFHDLDVLKLVVPGNHDVWVESKRALRRTQDSAWKYNDALAGIAGEYGFKYLPSAPFAIDGVGFVGSLGWYDYSLRDHRLDDVISIREYEVGKFATGTWNDVQNAAWLRYPTSDDWRRRLLRFTDPEVCDQMLKCLASHLETVSPTVQKMVAVVHTNPFEACIERKPVLDPFDAYEGSTRIGEILGRYADSHQVVVLCGHRHRRLDIREKGIRVLRSPVGYLQRFEGDLSRKAVEVVGVLDL